MRVAARRGMRGFTVALLLAVAACGSPGAGPTSGAPVTDPTSPVALLAVVEGRVTVRNAAGVEVPAAVDMSLTRGDTVITTPGALVVVLLANGYVLKLEEDQATPVKALAHLDDPPASESVAELFERTLGAEEFARVGGKDRLERIAGWNARRASGETPAPVARAEEQRAPARRAEEPAPAQSPPPVAGAPAPIATDPLAGPAESDDAPTDAKKEAKDDKGRPRLPSKKSDSGDGGGGVEASRPDKSSTNKRPTDEGRAEESESTPSSPPPPGNGAPAPKPSAGFDLADNWWFEAGSGGHVQKTGLPALLRSQRGALGECVATALPSVSEPELRLKVAGGVVKEVALGGGKPAPICAKGLVGKAVPEAGGDGWVVVRARR